MEDILPADSLDEWAVSKMELLGTRYFDDDYRDLADIAATYQRSLPKPVSFPKSHLHLDLICPAQMPRSKPYPPSSNLQMAQMPGLRPRQSQPNNDSNNYHLRHSRSQRYSRSLQASPTDLSFQQTHRLVSRVSQLFTDSLRSSLLHGWNNAHARSSTIGDLA